jgi:hypothetical protein
MGNYEATGGVPQLRRDFDALTSGRPVTSPRNGIRQGSTADGRLITERMMSRDKVPTLEIRRSALDSHSRITHEFRYSR